MFNPEFPVYPLGVIAPNIEGSLMYYIIEYPDGRQETLVVDDKSLDAPTVGKRRLALLGKGIKLFDLRKSIYFMHDLIKYHESQYHYIDNKGIHFRYSKQIPAKLVYAKIKLVIPMRNGGAVIEAENIPGRHKVLFAPRSEEKYAAFLQFNKLTYMLYGLYSEIPKASRRKI